ncbi:hypothetical protein BLK78_08240 [Klebsiella pneumoniae]|nr:hypothetical protein BLK78_08240 [Klebsiella pneumoniae]
MFPEPISITKEILNISLRASRSLRSEYQIKIAKNMNKFRLTDVGHTYTRWKNINNPNSFNVINQIIRLGVIIHEYNYWVQWFGCFVSIKQFFVIGYKIPEIITTTKKL